MQFITNGDFIFPFDFWHYFAKTFYLWSFQTGALNIDGITRLISRLPIALIFSSTNNLTASYFYLAICLVGAWAAAYFFLRSFFPRLPTSIKLLLATVFAINPVFLGNTAKVGLVLAVAILLVQLSCLKRAADGHRLSWLLPFWLATNISLIHPFTFAINLLVTGIFALVRFWPERDWLKHHIWPLAAWLVAGLLLNAYFILPLFQLQTIDKAALYQSIEKPTNYFTLIDIANTGDIFTSLSLSKNILKDFDFYNSQYRPVYFVAMFGLMLTILWLYHRNYARLTSQYKTAIIISAGALLLLMAISATTIFNLSELLKWLTTLPGGWIFRSPLKWQLYEPVALISLLAILFSHIPRRSREWGVGVMVLIITTIAANAYLINDIYQKLIIPRHVETFQDIAHTNLDQTKLLLVTSAQCLDDYQAHSREYAELNQILLSRDVQVTRVDVQDLDQLRLRNFGHIITCSQDLALPNFDLVKAYTDPQVYWFRNTHPEPLAYVGAASYTTRQPQGITDKQAIVDQLVDVGGVTTDEQVASGSIEALFSQLTRHDIHPASRTITDHLPAIPQTALSAARLFEYGPEQPVEEVSFPTQQLADGAKLSVIRNPKQPVATYYDPQAKLNNLLQNGSFESGLWQKTVQDCNNYDNAADIAMHRSSIASNGSHSLQLEATRHNACTSQQVVVHADSQYLLSLDFQSPNLRPGQVGIIFDDPKQTQQVFHLDTQTHWQEFNQVLTAPAGATHLSIYLYAFEPGHKVKAVNRYDNVQLVSLPAALQTFFLATGKPAATALPKLTYQHLDPADYKFTLSHVTGPFYLNLGDAYHPKWMLTAPTPTSYTLSGLLSSPAKLAGQTHFINNGSINGWRVDPTKLCASTPSVCHRETDGSLTIQLAAEFGPQRWFWLGSLISGLTLLLCLGWVVWQWARRRWQRRYRSRLDDALASGADSLWGEAAYDSDWAKIDNRSLPQRVRDLINGDWRRRSGP